MLLFNLEEERQVLVEDLRPEGERAEVPGMGAAGAGADEGSRGPRAEEPPLGDLFQAPFLPGV